VLTSVEQAPSVLIQIGQHREGDGLPPAHAALRDPHRRRVA